MDYKQVFQLLVTISYIKSSLASSMVTINCRNPPHFVNLKLSFLSPSYALLHLPLKHSVKQTNKNKLRGL
jgi:hypothetical protein